MTQKSFSPVPRAGSVHVPVTPPPRADGNALAGVGLMLVSTLVLTGMHFLVRYVGNDIHAFEIAFFRNLFGAIILIPLIWRAGPTALVAASPSKLGLRSVLGTVGMLAWFYGLTVVPTAEATALSFGGVVFASIGAVIFLGEVMRVRRWTATALCLAGMLVMVRPGFETVDFGIVMILISDHGLGCRSGAGKVPVANRVDNLYRRLDRHFDDNPDRDSRLVRLDMAQRQPSFSCCLP